MRAVGRRIQEQVGQGVARQVHGVGLLGGEDQALGRDPGLFRVGDQVGVGLRRTVQQPEHRSGRPLQDLHPAFEGEAADLLGAVEAAEHHGVVGKARVAPGRPVVGDDALAVIGLVAGQPHHLLRIPGLVPGRDDAAIGDDVVVEGAAHGARIAQPVHLDRRRAAGEHAEPGVTGVAIDVHQDVDPVGGDPARGGLVIERPDVDPMLSRSLDARAEPPVGRRAAVIGEDLDGGPVVQFEQLRHQVADGVVTQV